MRWIFLLDLGAECQMTCLWKFGNYDQNLGFDRSSRQSKLTWSADSTNCASSCPCTFVSTEVAAVFFDHHLVSYGV